VTSAIYTTIKILIQRNKLAKNSKALMLGLTIKENVSDTSESPSDEIIHQLKQYV
jgi:UDP-N-acetyl-D-mannosaminuronate dehydrogenase